MTKAKSVKSILFSVIIILAGGLLLLNNLHLLPQELPSWLFTWKTLLIVIGVFFLFNKNWFAGLLLIGTGKYFLLPDIYGIPRPDLYTLWPVLLIFIGMMILLHNLFPNKKKSYIKPEQKTQTSDYMENTVIFGGDYKKISSYDFKGGKIETIFGGLELDLTNCCLSKGENVIDVTVVMGGLTITVPREWNVKTNITPIMGGVFDEIQSMQDAYIDPAAEITIKGVTVMGGVEIKRV